MKLNELRRKFIVKEPELSKVFLACRIIEDKTIPTLGVNITSQPNLFYNPDYLDTLSNDEALATLKHEMYHLINLHPIRREERHPVLYNVAADLAINQYIKGLPKGCLEINMFKELAPKRHTESYYHTLFKNAKKIVVGFGKNDQLKGHEKWKESTDPESAERIMKDVMDSTKCDISKLGDEIDDDIKGKYAGIGSQNISKKLDHKQIQKVDWKEVLNTIKNTTKKRVKHQTIYRKNKRYPFLQGSARLKLVEKMGKRVIKKLIVALDVSGSISDQQCFDFLSNCEKLMPLVQDMTIIQCSYSIHDIDKIKENGKVLHPIEFTRKGNGGTSFVPVFDYIQKNKNPKRPEQSFVIYLTDLYGEFPQTPPENVHTIWISTEKSMTEVPFGQLYYLN